MQKSKKRHVYLILIILVLLISIGYALLSSNLVINGVGRIDSIKWDVHFENVVKTTNSTINPTVAPSIPASGKTQEISYDVTFDSPGQIYEFTVDVVNSGTIDAMIESFTSKIKIDDNQEEIITSNKSNLPSYMIYDVSYSDGISIANNHLLSAKSKETIKVKIGIKEDVTLDELKIAGGEKVYLNIKFDYRQVNGEEVKVRP